MTDKLHELADAIEESAHGYIEIDRIAISSAERDEIVRLLRQPDDIISRIISGAEPECEHSVRVLIVVYRGQRRTGVHAIRCETCGALDYGVGFHVPSALKKIYAAARARREGR